MASPEHDVSTSFVILIPEETSTRRRNRVSALLEERARARATSCWSWVWGEDQRERQNDDDQPELDAFTVIKADPGQVFWSTQVLALTSSEMAHEAPTDRAAPAPPTADDDTLFLGVVPSPDADLTSMASPQSHDAGNCSDLMEETKTFSSTESLRQLSQQLNGLVSEDLKKYVDGVRSGTVEEKGLPAHSADCKGAWRFQISTRLTNHTLAAHLRCLSQPPTTPQPPQPPSVRPDLRRD